MTQLLPDKDKQGPLAWMLVAVAAVVVYFLGFSWYFDARAEQGERTDALLESEARFNGTLQQRQDLEQAMEAIGQFEQANDFFLTESNASLASSALTTKLKALITEHATDPSKCLVMSNRPARQTGQTRFERVAISVQMRCNVGDLARVFFQLESSTPYLFVDNLNIQKRSTRRRQGRQVVTEEYLDVKFDLAGYLRA